MWIFRWILNVVIFAVAVGLAMQNTEQRVVVSFLKWQSIPLPVWAVMYIAFFAGVAFWMISAIFRIINLSSENRKIQKENQSLKEELDRLRNVSVEESLLILEQPRKSQSKRKQSSEA